MKRDRIKILTGSMSIILGIAIGIFATAQMDIVPKAMAEEDPPVSHYIPDIPSLAPIVETTKSHIVTVTSSRTIRGGRIFYSPFFSLPHEYTEEGLGSGVIVSNDGYIVTNAHVIEGAEDIIVGFSGRQYDASIVGKDIRSDIAVLKIESDTQLPAAQLGDSDEMKVGDWVLAIGNPYELEHTVTSGIISAKGRSNMGIVDYEDFLQTDAAINPGNSGGALVNLRGQVIGINTAIASRTGGFQGIGLAIPSNLVQKVINQLIDKGFVERGWLGVMLQNVTPDLEEAMALSSSKGALITSVLDDSPADKAGIKEGDVVIAVDGQNIQYMNDLRNRIALTAPETEVEISIDRDGRIKVLYPVLSGMPGAPKEPLTQSGSRIGIRAASLTAAMRREYNVPDYLDNALVITDIESNSPADYAGLRSGDVILEINRKTIKTTGDFTNITESLPRGRVALFVILRDGEKFYTGIRIS